MKIKERLGKFLGREPLVDPTAYLAPSAVVIGDVRVGPYASIWPTAVLRGDINFIQIGQGTNVQDGAVIHLADDYPVEIGNFVTIGHLAVVHACRVEDECLIGMHATVLDGAVIGHHSIIGAHTLVRQGMKVLPGSLVVGVPGKVVRRLSEEEQKSLCLQAEKYIAVAAAHRAKQE